MKKINKLKIGIALLSLTFAASIFTSCDILSDLSKTLPTTETSKPQLSNNEIIAGLKEALNVGTQNSVNILSKQDGFLKDPKVFIKFPQEANKVKEYALMLGMDNQVNKFEETLNRAAELATKEAVPVFTNAIKSMSFADAKAILQGGDNAATNYFKRQTSDDLYNLFYPKVKQATEKVALTRYWDPLVTQYNKTTGLTGKEKVETDLNDYVTKQALNGLFLKLADEEKLIRKDPVARVTDILKKVFGSL